MPKIIQIVFIFYYLNSLGAPVSRTGAQSTGEGEIRTRDTVSRMPPFQGGALGHYATSPLCAGLRFVIKISSHELEILDKLGTSRPIRPLWHASQEIFERYLLSVNGGYLSVRPNINPLTLACHLAVPKIKFHRDSG